MDYLAIIIITFIAGVVGTGVGGIIGAILRKDSNKIVSLLLAFAGGVMLGVVCFDLMIEPLGEFKGDFLENVAPFFIVLAVSFGYVIIWLLNNFIDKATNHEIKHASSKTHPKTADNLNELIHSDHFEKHNKEKDHLFVAGLVMMFAIALHNLPEGMVIGASYTKTEDVFGSLFLNNDNTHILSTGFIMAIIIGLHNIPEGMAVSVPLISGGMRKGRAMLLTALSGFPTVIGALLGYALGEISAIMSLISIGFASGAMLYVILGELLPEAILMWKSKLPALSTFIGLLVGFLVVLF